MRILYITTIGKTMGFFKAFIKELIEEGNTTDNVSNMCQICIMTQIKYK